MYLVERSTHNWLIKRLLNDKISARLPALSGLVVDLGCGTRPFEPDVLRFADAYIGVDWSQTLHGLHADVIADLNDSLPFSDNSVDHIVSFEVLEHLAEPSVMLREAHRILRNGGEITLSVPFQWWVHESPWDYQRFTRHGLTYQLGKAGFQVTQLEETSGFWSMWVLKLNYQLARIPKSSNPLRRASRIALIPFWWTAQHLAIQLDKIWQESRETAGYFVVARKP